MKMPDELTELLLAPCGMNCLHCYAHLRAKNVCPGCRMEVENKPRHCQTCAIKQCAGEHAVTYCVDCPQFPCARIKRMDKRYRERYHISLIANARRLRADGAAAYLQAEKQRWTCAQCGGVISVHHRVCSACAAPDAPP